MITITIEALDRRFIYKIDGMDEKSELEAVINIEDVLDTRAARLGLPFDPYFPSDEDGERDISL
jgi:hypothetical protein